MSLKYKLRRAKWLAKGVRNGGVRDFRVIGLAFVKRFEPHSGSFDFYAWAIPSKKLLSKPKLVVTNDGNVVFSDELEWSFDQEACDYEGMNSKHKFGLHGFYTYSSSQILHASIEFKTAQSIYTLELGNLPATKHEGFDDGTVINPWAPGQLGNVTTGYLMSQKGNQSILSNDVSTTVDIIIPVYNGYEFLEKLLATVVRTRVSCRYIIVDDCSPDNRIAPLLDSFKKKHPQNSTVIKNETNQGFVKSVNAGLACSRGHVVLINTDTELPNLWLERLIRPIMLDNLVASVTPMTNSGTICSFPKFLENNELPGLLTADEVDAYFASINPAYTEVPTGVGFCMAMSRSALDTVGVLDSDTFGKGYGEENDWCQRAKKAGFKNLICENLFVYHKHGGSFSSEEKALLNERNMAKLSKKHPDYLVEVAKHCSDNPLEGLRSFICAQIEANGIMGPNVVIYSHLLGGGAAFFHRKKRKELLQNGNNVIMVYYSDFDHLYHTVVYRADGQPGFQFTSNDIHATLSPFNRIDIILVNELATYPKINTAISYILSSVQRMKAELFVYIHDFLPLCPNLNLLSSDNRFCGLPDSIIKCQNCYVASNNDRYTFSESITEYRAAWNNLLSAAQKVIVFSKSSERLVGKVYSNLNNLSVEPHDTTKLGKVNTDKYHHDGIHIGIIGNLTLHKGLTIIEGLLESAGNHGCNEEEKVSFIQFGISPKFFSHPLFESTGEYNRDTLPSLVEEKEIDVFILPSIWPETFSFTCSEIIDMDIPAVCLNLGAPAERIGKYKKGLVLSYPADPMHIENEAPVMLSEIVEHARLWRNDAF